MSMTGIERIGRILKRQPVDRIGVFEHFWGDTQKQWVSDGKIREGEDLNEHFNYDMALCWAFRSVADLDFEPVTIEEDAETRLVRDGNGALLRSHKLHDTTPEHVDFSVKERPDWERLIKPKLTPDRRRIDFEGYRKARAQAKAQQRFFMWSGVNVFELMHPICGHQYMLMGMIEVKAGMDLTRIYRNFGERLTLIGGIDVRVLYSNDLRKVDAELQAKIPIVKGHYGYVLHSDHSIPATVNYDTYQYFVKRGLELGAY